MWIKICANTSVEDALAAAALGADAVGFVFAPSRRQVSAAQVKTITAELPHGIETVGVFTGGEGESIARSAAEAGLKTVQLHGGVDLAFATRLRRQLPAGVNIIHTTHWTLDHGAASAGRVAAALAQVSTEPDAPRLLVDAKLGGSSGGLGVSFNWSEARPVLSRAGELGVRLIVAGGLDPENVSEAIHRLRPWGIDVASGVEHEPGRKDHARLKAFLENARRA